MKLPWESAFSLLGQLAPFLALPQLPCAATPSARDRV